MTGILDVENKIVTLRNQQVILDADVAELYGVETKRINEAVGNNPEKFPEGYVWMLDNQEFAVLRSKFSTAKLQKTRQNPKAFTEKGCRSFISHNSSRGWHKSSRTDSVVRQVPRASPLTHSPYIGQKCLSPQRYND